MASLSDLTPEQRQTVNAFKLRVDPEPDEAMRLEGIDQFDFARLLISHADGSWARYRVAPDGLYQLMDRHLTAWWLGR